MIALQISLTIYTFLQIELVYFTVCALWYIYYTPEYRAFFAAFWRSPPSDIPTDHEDQLRCNYSGTKSTDRDENITLVEQLHSNTDGHQTETPVMTLTTSRVEFLSSSGFVFEADKITNKKIAFIHYGLQTLMHCVGVFIFLLFAIIYISFRMAMELITATETWANHLYFCRNVVKFRLVAFVPPNYIFLIFLCSSALKSEFIRRSLVSPKSNNKLIYISIGTIVWCTVCALVQTSSYLLNAYDVIDFFETGVSVCYRTTELNPILWTYNNAQWLVCLCLTFFVLLSPLCLHCKTLKNLPNAKADVKIQEILKEIYLCQKKVAMMGLPFVSCLVLINVSQNLNIKDHDIAYGMLVGYIIIWVNLHVVMMAIYKDWRQRLCPWYYDKYYFKVSRIGSDGYQVKSTEQSSTTIPEQLPRLIKGPSTLDKGSTSR